MKPSYQSFVQDVCMRKEKDNLSDEFPNLILDMNRLPPPDRFKQRTDLHFRNPRN